MSLAALPVSAQVSLEALVTPLGGSFRYDITIANGSGSELALVSLLDAPLADPLIDPSLTGPPGFLTSYDDVLGIIDFLADTSTFAPGGSVGGFSFESLAGPGGYFSTFAALDVSGGSYSATVHYVPETRNTLAGMAVLAGVAWQAARRLRPRP